MEESIFASISGSDAIENERGAADMNNTNYSTADHSDTIKDSTTSTKSLRKTHRTSHRPSHSVRPLDLRSQQPLSRIPNLLTSSLFERNRTHFLQSKSFGSE